MRVAVLSDIHSNWHAMKAVLDDAGDQGAEAVWCLGDVVGYGPNPLRCWQELAQHHRLLPAAWVAGNHDWGLIGRLEATYFVSLMKEIDGPTLAGDFADHAWAVICQQRTILQHNPALLESLAELPLMSSPLPGVHLTHGMFGMDAREIIGTYSKVPEFAERSQINLTARLPDQANANHDELRPIVEHGWQVPRLMLVGHTHRACAWQPRNSQPDGSRWDDSTALLDAGQVWFDDLVKRPVFANPGSVGFPRDFDPSFATYMLVDWQETRVGLWLRRVKYDPSRTIQEMRDIGISEVVIRQLELKNRSKKSSEIMRGGRL